MSQISPAPTVDTRTKLAHALGYHDYPSDATAEPYLTYIANRHVNGDLDDYLMLFIETVEFFDYWAKCRDPSRDDRIQALLDKLCASTAHRMFKSIPAGSTERHRAVEDTVMHVVGTWSMMLSSFTKQKWQGSKVRAAHSLLPSKLHLTAISIYDNNVTAFVSGSGLLPGGRWDRRADLGKDAATRLMTVLLSASIDRTSGQVQTPGVLPLLDPGVAPGISSDLTTALDSAFEMFEGIDVLESTSIRTTQLNAFTLDALSAVQVTWTDNISRHMLLTKSGGRHHLELFSLPCAFEGINFVSTGVHSELMQEIQESYAMLFNAWPGTPLHLKFGTFWGVHRFCWCWHCSARRHRQRCIAQCKQNAGTRLRRLKVGQEISQTEFDPMLVELVEKIPYDDWTSDVFPNLWIRITRLEQHLHTSRPWSLWVLFRDSRDTFQFWTFLFATIVLFLTLLQVLLGIAQVVGSFEE